MYDEAIAVVQWVAGCAQVAEEGSGRAKLSHEETEADEVQASVRLTQIGRFGVALRLVFTAFWKEQTMCRTTQHNGSLAKRRTDRSMADTVLKPCRGSDGAGHGDRRQNAMTKNDQTKTKSNAGWKK